ncbi:MAG: leucine-rich repeat protein [Ruminococcus flavefaciens]|nr:leucine-rich repeat protein [Ruminococcus flavefaciens]MCM1229541.1 leucine-rich repeat protein [Ruminococcus flavefaciens]
MKIRKIIAGIMTSALLLNTAPVCSNNFRLITNAESLDYVIDYTTGTYENLQYKKYSDYIEISDCDKSVTEIIIPSEIDDLPVTTIGNGAFGKCTSLISVTIPDSVTIIDGNAFIGCTNLTSINIPDSITSIGYSAFFICSSLKSITIPYGVTEIGENTFSGCTSLTSITIPDSVTSIDTSAFHNCKSLLSITIPDSVTSIGGYAFRNCTSLTSITISNNVTSIGQYAFRDCTNLKSVTIKNPECKIYDNEYTINIGIIYGYENSTAQAYAEKYGYTFEVLDEAPEIGTGDINGNGTTDVADLVLLNRHILAQITLTAQQCERADLCKDDRIDISDVIELRKLVTSD